MSVATSPLRDAWDKFNRLLPAFILILVSASGFYTYRGASLLADASGWMDKCAALVVAVACTATLYFLWRGVLLLIPHLDGARLSLSNIVIAIVLALALAIGACLNFVGMAGPDALRRVIADLPSAYTMVFNGAKEAAQVGLAPAVDLQIKAAQFEAMRDNDLKVGGKTGIIGRGPFVARLESIVGALNAAVQQATEKSTLATSLTRDAEQQLDRMRKDATSEKPVYERRDAVKADAERLIQTLSDLASIDLTEEVQKAAAAASDAANSTGGGQDPNPAFHSLATEVAAWAKRVVDEAKRRKAATVLAPPPPMPTINQAALTQMSGYMPQAAIAILLDLAPVPVLALNLLVFWQLRKSEGTERDGIGHRISYADAIALRNLFASQDEGKDQTQPPLPAVPPTTPRRANGHAVADADDAGAAG